MENDIERSDNADEYLSAQQLCVSLETKVKALKQTKTYPERPTQVDVVETHMSWVFLTNRNAYKLKKAVRYAFLDFSTVEARRTNCAKEVRLNRRLAQNVYIDMVPLTIDSMGNVALDGDGAVIDWLVKMRRLPSERMLDYLITHHTAKKEDIRSSALLLSKFYKGSPSIQISSFRYRDQFEQDINYNMRELTRPNYGLPIGLVKNLHNAQLELLRREPMLLDERIAEGRIIEGHGDLRPGHICLEPDPVIIDCLEFNRRFRIVDPVDELSFLAMECECLGAPYVGSEFIRTYKEITKDHPHERLVQFYMTYRASLRARLAIWHTLELEEKNWPAWRDLANAYLRIADIHSQQL